MAVDKVELQWREDGDRSGPFIVFVGISIGGMIAQKLAFKRPDLVSRLVLSNTAPKMATPQMWKQRIASIKTGSPESIANDIMERWFGSKFLKSRRAGIWRDLLLRTSQQGDTGSCQAIADADLTRTTETLSQPVLVLSTADDQAGPPRLSAYFKDTAHV